MGAMTLLGGLLFTAMVTLAQTGFSLPVLSVLEETLLFTEQWIQQEEAREARRSADTLVPATQRERPTGTVAASATTESGSLSITVDGAAVVLRDVPRAAWFAPYVRSGAELGILGGYRDAAGTPTGLFGPGDRVTVAELAKLAVFSAKISPSSCVTTPNNPAAADAWFSSVLACAEERNWVLYGDGTVDPLRPATRAEVVVTLLQAMQATITPLSGESGPFTDVSASAQYAAAIAKAKRDGIVNGYADASGSPTGLFGPQDGVTRAEAAKMTILSLQTYGR